MPGSDGWISASTPPDVGRMVFDQNERIVWWGGVNWYDRINQIAAAVLKWRPIETGAAILKWCPAQKGVPSLNDADEAAPTDLLVEVADGKYTVKTTRRGLVALRYGESWRDCTGDNLIYSLAAEVDRLRSLMAEKGLITPCDPQPDHVVVGMHCRLNLHYKDRSWTKVVAVTTDGTGIRLEEPREGYVHWNISDLEFGTIK
jgi:hypothetical protein